MSVTDLPYNGVLEPPAAPDNNQLRKNGEFLDLVLGMYRDAGLIEDGQTFPKFMSDILDSLNTGKPLHVLGPHGSGKSALIETLIPLLYPLSNSADLDNPEAIKVVKIDASTTNIDELFQAVPSLAGGRDDELLKTVTARFKELKAKQELDAQTPGYVTKDVEDLFLEALETVGPTTARQKLTLKECISDRLRPSCKYVLFIDDSFQAGADKESILMGLISDGLLGTENLRDYGLLTTMRANNSTQEETNSRIEDLDYAQGSREAWVSVTPQDTEILTKAFLIEKFKDTFNAETIAKVFELRQAWIQKGYEGAEARTGKSRELRLANATFTYDERLARQLDYSENSIEYLLSWRTMEHLIGNAAAGLPTKCGLPISAYTGSEQKVILYRAGENGTPGRDEDVTEEFLQELCKTLNIPYLNHVPLLAPAVLDAALNPEHDEYQPCLFVGDPGIGKSTWFNAEVERRGYEIVNWSMTTLNIDQYVAIIPDVTTGRLTTQLSEKLVSENEKVLIIDEFSRNAPPHVQAMVMELVLHGTLGGEKIPGLKSVICLMNPITFQGMDMNTDELSITTADRFAHSSFLLPSDIPNEEYFREILPSVLVKGLSEPMCKTLLDSGVDPEKWAAEICVKYLEWHGGQASNTRSLVHYRILNAIAANVFHTLMYNAKRAALVDEHGYYTTKGGVKMPLPEKKLSLLNEFAMDFEGKGTKNIDQARILKIAEEIEINLLEGIGSSRRRGEEVTLADIHGKLRYFLDDMDQDGTVETPAVQLALSRASGKDLVKYREEVILCIAALPLAQRAMVYSSWGNTLKEASQEAPDWTYLMPTIVRIQTGGWGQYEEIEDTLEDFNDAYVASMKEIAALEEARGRTFTAPTLPIQLGREEEAKRPITLNAGPKVNDGKGQGR